MYSRTIRSSRSARTVGAPQISLHPYPVIQSKNEGPTTPSNKAPKLFISHASKDVEFVQCLVHLFESIGLTNKDVFCSSLPRYGIPNDEDLFTALLEQFRKYALHVIVVHSQNYYKSPISLNEMGAAWVLHAKCTSFLLPGFPVEGMEGVVNRNTIAIKLDDDELSVKDRMNQFYNTIIDEFGLAKMDELLWEEKRDVFIRSVKGLHYEIVKNHDNENEENGAQ